MVGEIEVVGSGEIVVVFFVIEGPVVRVGHGRRRAHVFAHGLRIVQHFDLHGLVVALLRLLNGPLSSLCQCWSRPPLVKVALWVKGTMAQFSPTSWLQAATTPGALMTSSTSGMSSGVTRSPVPTACLFALVDPLVDCGWNAQAFRG